MAGPSLDQARLAAQQKTGNSQVRTTQFAFNDGWNSAVEHLHSTIFSKTQREAILLQWLHHDFRDACIDDVKRIQEATWMLKIGLEKEEPIEQVLQTVITTFVRGLILNEAPITVPTEKSDDKKD